MRPENTALTNTMLTGAAKIERGIPLPPPREANSKLAVGASLRENLVNRLIKMNPGDSFFVNDAKKNGAALQGPIGGRLGSYCRTTPELKRAKFATRISTEAGKSGVRIWRTA